LHSTGGNTACCTRPNFMSRGTLHILRPDEVRRSEAGERSAPRTVAALLVEDDAAMAASLRDALRQDGLEIATAANGREALDLLRSGLRPSAIILDLLMPVMDGWDFRQEQRRDPALKDIPVVVTATGFSAETIRAQFGDVDLLPKPVPYSDLLARLGHASNARSSAA
jgi:CheY-like chemotaxis protein